MHPTDIERTLAGVNYKLYDSIHHKLGRYYGKAPFCIFDDSHESKRYEWANVTGNITSDIEDYLPMCLSCHRKFDVTDKARQLSHIRMLNNACAKRTKVSQIEDGEVIAQFDSVAEAARKTGTSRTGILSVLTGEFQTSGGYKWEKA